MSGYFLSSSYSSFDHSLQTRTDQSIYIALTNGIMHGDDMTMNGASKFANDGPTDADTLARMEQLKAKYADEASKRFEMRPEGEAQFLDMRLSDRYIHWLDDPWAQTDNQIVRDPSLDEGNHCKYLVIGTGFAGLLFAARLIQKGVDPSEIRMVDRARGYGGTWYWNRFPGLACDIESYVYIPLLEELGWMPKHKVNAVV